MYYLEEYRKNKKQILKDIYSETLRLRNLGLAHDNLIMDLAFTQAKQLCGSFFESGDVQSDVWGVITKALAAERTCFELNQDGDSQRFVFQHGMNVRYCHVKNTWYLWDVNRWTSDDKAKRIQLCLDTIRSIGREAGLIKDNDLGERMEKYSRQSRKHSHISAVLKFAQTIPSIALMPEDLDTNPWLLNVNNGTIDLKTGELLPHSRDHLITKLAPVDYHPEIQSVTWLRFLDKIFGGNDDLVKYVQRVVGYSLTGDTREKCLFFFIGETDTGKSTFVEALRHVLGDYAKATDFETFIAGGRRNIRNDIARLEKTRFVSAVEARRGDKFDEQLVKQVTGRDTFMARFLYKEFFEFSPEFKIFLAANHTPTIRGVDDAIWNRFHVIPFNVRIPKQDQDKQLLQRLKDQDTGILSWAVKGCLDYQKLGGLFPPKEVQEAVRNYRIESDEIYHFIHERCRLGGEETSARLYAEYEDWCGENEEEPVSKKKFGMMLAERDGIRRVRKPVGEEGKQARGYVGISLKSTLREQIRQAHRRNRERFEAEVKGELVRFLKDRHGGNVPENLDDSAVIYQDYLQWCSENRVQNVRQETFDRLMGG
jgi:putative DNA primase/helicase